MHLYDFPADDPDRALLKLKGEDRFFAEAELALARCEFARARKLFEKLSQSERYLHQAIRIGVNVAIGLGDLRFLDSVLRLKEQFRLSAGEDSTRRVLADLTKGWLAQWLWLPTGYPEWIVRFDYSGGVPEPWWHPAAYLGVMARLNAGQFESAYATAALLMSFGEADGGSGRNLTASSVYLRMARAIACRETGREDEMYKWLSGVVRELAPHGFFLPFLIFMHCSRKSPVEELLAEVAPGEISRYRELSRTYFVNLIRARNHVTGERATDVLTYREFYFAMLLKRKLSCKELAMRSDLSVGRIKNILSCIYQKLQIYSRSEVSELVW